LVESEGAGKEKVEARIERFSEFHRTGIEPNKKAPSDFSLSA
jgi:hypothetical protein